MKNIKYHTVGVAKLKNLCRNGPYLCNYKDYYVKS